MLLSLFFSLVSVFFAGDAPQPFLPIRARRMPSPSQFFSRAYSILSRPRRQPKNAKIFTKAVWSKTTRPGSEGFRAGWFDRGLGQLPVGGTGKGDSNILRNKQRTLKCSFSNRLTSRAIGITRFETPFVIINLIRIGRISSLGHRPIIDKHTVNGKCPQSTSCTAVPGCSLTPGGRADRRAEDVTAGR